MDEKIRYFLIFGVVLLAIKFLVQYIAVAMCETGGLGCLAQIIIFESPGILIGGILGLGYNAAGIVNIPVYFIIGGIIGLIVYKVRNKK